VKAREAGSRPRGAEDLERELIKIKKDEKEGKRVKLRKGK